MGKKYGDCEYDVNPNLRQGYSWIAYAPRGAKKPIIASGFNCDTKDQAAQEAMAAIDKYDREKIAKGRW